MTSGPLKKQEDILREEQVSHDSFYRLTDRPTDRPFNQQPKFYRLSSEHVADCLVVKNHVVALEVVLQAASRLWHCQPKRRRTGVGGVRGWGWGGGQLLYPLVFILESPTLYVP